MTLGSLLGHYVSDMVRKRFRRGGSSGFQAVTVLACDVPRLQGECRRCERCQALQGGLHTIHRSPRIGRTRIFFDVRVGRWRVNA